MSFKVYIPARFASVRLPGKPLLEVAGKTILQHVYERGLASGATEVVVATDDARIFECVRAFGGTAVMTSPAHASGTDRVAEAARLREETPATRIVNLQGDEPLMPAAVIRQVAALVDGQNCEFGTICEPLRDDAEWRDPNVVKVIRVGDDSAAYFSRAPVPFVREARDCPDKDEDWRFRHVGIYAYTMGFLQRFVNLPPSRLEQLERLEQLRALSAGCVIKVALACEPCGIGIDTPADLARFNAYMQTPAVAR